MRSYKDMSGSEKVQHWEDRAVVIAEFKSTNLTVVDSSLDYNLQVLRNNITQICKDKEYHVVSGDVFLSVYLHGDLVGHLLTKKYLNSKKQPPHELIDERHRFMKSNPTGINHITVENLPVWLHLNTNS